MPKNRDPWPSNAKLLKRLCDYAGKLRTRLGDYGFGPTNAISQIGNGYPQVIHIMRHSLYFTPWMRHSLYFWKFESGLCVIVYTPGCPKMGICVIIYTLWMLRRKSGESRPYTTSHLDFNKKQLT